MLKLISGGLLCRSLIDLDGPGFPDYGYPIDRPLYLHQEQAIKKLKNRRNVVVATGTGSGKTESFLLPIIDHILREKEAGTLEKPGIRALLLYPMNALANDQLKRLRRLLAKLPEITFGRYTGQTQEDRNAAEQDFRRVFPNEPRIDNELISRDEIRESPPHILLTNYAMLEYLLLRPKDTSLFEGVFSDSWAFVVVDEAHSYSGASGMEVGMLLRRLKERVASNGQAALRCIATSATLGAGKIDFPQVAEFGKALFDETFEWIEEDENRQDIIEPTIIETSYFEEPWGKPPSSLYEQLIAANEDIPEMAEIAVRNGVPSKILNHATEQSNDKIEFFLYHLLKGDQRVQSLKEILKKAPATIEKIATMKDIFGKEGDDMLPALVSLVSLCIKALPGYESAPLISARYHLFCRALAGAFITFPINNPIQLHLETIDNTEIDGISYQAFEIASCTRCGHVMLSGFLDNRYSLEGEVQQGEFLRPFRPFENEASIKKIFFSWDTMPESIVDEDESALADTEPNPVTSNPGTLCTACGAFQRGTDRLPCNCEQGRHIVVYEAPLKDNRLAICPACGAQTPYEDIAHRFYTGRDAPAAVLATSLYQHLLPEAMSEHPGGSRKLLTFSDSRQDAAFFAPYLESTHRTLLKRRLVHKAISQHAEKYGVSPARPHGLAETFLNDLSRELKLFPSPSDPAREHKERCSWIFQELLTLDRRLGLEGTGLLAIRYTMPPGWKSPKEFLNTPWEFCDDDVWRLMEIMLDSLRFSGCLSITPADITATEFEPRNRLVYCRETGGDQTRGMTVLGWLPRRDFREHITNRRFDYLRRVLKNRTGQEINPEDVMILLRLLWREATKTPLMKEVMSNRAGVLYQIDPSYIEMHLGLSKQIEWRQCSFCNTVRAFDVESVCPTMNCKGEMLPFDAEKNLENHHYRRLYLNMAPIPMVVSEHTAQWGPKKAAGIQQKFMDGEVNTLSCSTTFELGVDVGELQAVLMRNFPPSTSNYVQRAGRAGRRTGSPAFALTYAQRRPHDMFHFSQPEGFITGKIKPPAIEIHNPKIVRRHIHSVAFAEFFRRYPETYKTVETFFCKEDCGAIGPLLFENMLSAKPKSLLDSLSSIVPDDPVIQNELDIGNWGWLPNLIEGDNPKNFKGLLGNAAVEVITDLDHYEQLEQEASAEKNYRRAEALSRQANNIRRRHLLGFLASRNVLPKYGFPVDVVELRLKPSSNEAQELSLERDLKIAISEYAPGGEIVAGHKVWKSTGIRYLPGRNPLEFAYIVCPHCGRFHKNIERESLLTKCSACGEEMRGRGLKNGILIQPAFGFFSNEEPEKVRRRPQRSYSSRVFFSEHKHSNEEPEQDFSNFPSEEFNKQIILKYRFSRQGELVVVNSGQANRGFIICQSCGYARPAPIRYTKELKAHENAFGKPCKGRFENRHLGHEFLSDVLEIRLNASKHHDPEKSLWWSLLYGLLQGASEALGIERQDIDGCLYPYGEKYLPPAIVLFDVIPGGAGHVRRIGENLSIVLKETYNLLSTCQSCDEETACYACLKTYDNQFCHEALKRGPAARYIDEFIHTI